MQPEITKADVDAWLTETPTATSLAAIESALNRLLRERRAGLSVYHDHDGRVVRVELREVARG